MRNLTIRSLVLSLTVAAGLFIGSHAGATGLTDAPRHDVYAATARCWQVEAGKIPGMPVTSVMRDDEDAIDSAVQRYADLGMTCLGTLDVQVVYIP